MTDLKIPLSGKQESKTTIGIAKDLEQHYEQGHIPKTSKDCPTCQETCGPVVRHHLRSDRAGQFGTSHVD
eukprot:12933937-Prorocentrum_lima.AAC.1